MDGYNPKQTEKDKRYVVAVDPKTLFPDEQFFFLPNLPNQEQLEGKAENTLTATDCSPTLPEEPASSPFFFHWHTLELCNREDHHFHNKSKDKEEKGWADWRTALKNMLRKSHRHARQSTHYI